MSSDSRSAVLFIFLLRFGRFGREGRVIWPCTLLNAGTDVAGVVAAHGPHYICMFVMGVAVPGLHSASPTLASKPFAAVASCVCSGSNWLRLPLRRSDVGASHGVRWSVAAGRTGRERHCPPVCSSATVPTRLYDGVAEDVEDYIKAGGEELDLVQMQASKSFEQPKIAEKVRVCALVDVLVFFSIAGVYCCSLSRISG